MKNRELAAAASLRRICMPKARSGRLDVPKDIHQKFIEGGPARKELLSMLMSVGGNKERLTCFVHSNLSPWSGELRSLPMHSLEAQLIRKIEHIRLRSRKNKLHVEAGWYSKEGMKRVLGWSPPGAQHCHRVIYFHLCTSYRGSIELIAYPLC